MPKRFAAAAFRRLPRPSEEQPPIAGFRAALAQRSERLDEKIEALLRVDSAGEKNDLLLVTARRPEVVRQRVWNHSDLGSKPRRLFADRALDGAGNGLDARGVTVKTH